MMNPCFSVCWSVFVKAKISPHLIFLTAGELGITLSSQLKPAEMAIIRQNEAIRAMEFLGASLTILNFPDLHLAFIPLEILISAVLPIIRADNTDAIFSFDPNETTTSFDHPDHNVAGQVAKYVGAASDVKHFFPQTEALKQRPELYLWTSKSAPANRSLQLSPAARNNRNNYLTNFYPSQFQHIQKNTWVTIFDSITHATENKHEERYIKVR